MIECSLVLDKTQTAFGPLCAFGHHLTLNGVLEPLEQVDVPQKTVRHSPAEKLTDALIGMLAGCEALYQLNVRVRPDLPLQEAFGREGEGLADQSTISDTLNAFEEGTVAQLRGAVESIHRLHSGIFRHDFEREMLVLEVDLTGLTASEKAEGSKKGYFPNKRNKRGRQLVRVIAPQYGEILFEKLYWGNTNSSEVLKATIKEVERILPDLAEQSRKRKQTLIRVDGGFGTDENLKTGCAGAATSSSARGTPAGGPRRWPRACPKRSGGRDPPRDSSLGYPANPTVTGARPGRWRAVGATRRISSTKTCSSRPWWI